MPRKLTKKTARDPFEVKLTEDRATELLDFLVREIQYAEQARDSIVGDDRSIDAAHLMYEGGDRELTKNTPWPGASNLGSFIVTEKVDAMESRIVSTLFADPVWIVEGYGRAAERAPFVEAYHQWKSETEKLQTYLSRVTKNSLIEGTGVLEVTDRVVLRSGPRRIRALIQRDEQTGQAMLDDFGNPVVVRTQEGKYVEAEADTEPHVDLVVSDVVRASDGPSYRVLSLKNFFLLPGHASEREDIWGYAKRFWRRLPDLRRREKDGFYKNIDALGKAGEREQTPSESRAGQDIAPQYDQTADKEIWEVTVLMDLDEDGFEEWYVVTLSVLHRTLLRVQYQDYGTPHYLLFVPFPRGNSVYGYSYAYDKLGTIYDEHAALRNMFMDRTNLATSAPFMQLEGGLYDPSRKPFGPRQCITVRDMSELKQLDVKDVPSSVITAIQMALSAAERISGQNDVTTGHMAAQDRTLGEVNLVAQQSFVRIDSAVKNFQEGMEDLFDILHIIRKYKLSSEPEPMPGEVLRTMQERSPDFSGEMITADMLEGIFRGKPHGSVESADYKQMRAEFAQMLTALTQLAQAVPALQAHLNDPRVIRSIVSQIARVYRWPDRSNLVGTFTGQMKMPQVPPGGPGPSAPMKGAPPNASPAALRPFARRA